MRKEITELKTRCVDGATVRIEERQPIEGLVSDR